MTAAAQLAIAAEDDVDVCILVEGTYPYVAGGVSAWVHEILRSHAELAFSIFNIGSSPGSYGEPRYVLPENVRRLDHAYCQDGSATPPAGAARAELDRQIRRLRAHAASSGSRSRVLGALRRLLLDDAVDDQLLSDLTCGDLDVATFLHGQETFRLLAEVAERVAPRASFLDLFWHVRAILVPILRLLAVPPPPARCYHAVSTGYAGLLGAAFSLRTGRPLMVTEHGIYSRERNMELARAGWIKDLPDGALEVAAAPPSPLRALWSRSFRSLAAVAYHRAARIVTLSEVNRQRQIADGAPPAKISVVCNGVDLRDAPCAEATEPAIPVRDIQARPSLIRTRSGAWRPPLRVGFVGRVVPIKDVVTFIKACDIAMRTAPIDARIIGPAEEDPLYAGRCRALVETLGRQASIRFLGPRPVDTLYADLDVVVLTSFSEGQPLVILEAYAAGLPVVTSDVGACREMVEGRDPADCSLGKSGFVTRVAAPSETAAALVKLARDPALRRRLGGAGRARVAAFYQRRDMIESYRALYREMVTP